MAIGMEDTFKFVCTLCGTACHVDCFPTHHHIFGCHNLACQGHAPVSAPPESPIMDPFTETSFQGALHDTSNSTRATQSGSATRVCMTGPDVMPSSRGPIHNNSNITNLAKCGSTTQASVKGLNMTPSSQSPIIINTYSNSSVTKYRSTDQVSIKGPNMTTLSQSPIHINTYSNTSSVTKYRSTPQVPMKRKNKMPYSQTTVLDNSNNFSVTQNGSTDQTYMMGPVIMPFAQGPIFSNGKAVSVTQYGNNSPTHLLDPVLQDSAQGPSQDIGASACYFARSGSSSSADLAKVHTPVFNIPRPITPIHQTPSGNTINNSTMQFSPIKLKSFRRSGLMLRSLPKLSSEDTEDTQEPSMDEVYPGLFVGQKECFTEHFLRKHGITAVVTVMTQPILDHESSSLSTLIPIKDRLFLRAEDTSHQDLLQYLPGACEFIDKRLYPKLFAKDDDTETRSSTKYYKSILFGTPKFQRTKKHKILIHCRMGISRSASVAIAYIMYKKQQSLEDTMWEVSLLRPRVNPNSNFKMQLQVWYNSQFNLYSDPVDKTWNSAYLEMQERLRMQKRLSMEKRLSMQEVKQGCQPV